MDEPQDSNANNAELVRSDEHDNVVIIENSGGECLSDGVEVLDPSLVRYVKQLLQESGAQQSVIIVNQGDGCEQTFQFGLQSPEEYENEVQSSGQLDPTALPIVPAATQIASTEVDIGEPQTSVGSSAASDANSTVVTVREQVSSLAASGGILPVTHHNAATISTLSTSGASSAKERTFSKCTVVPSTSDSQPSSQISPTVSSPNQSKALDMNSVPQVAAEHLLDIAQKMISVKSRDSTLTPHLKAGTKDDSAKTAGESSRSKADSVITMYLSSPTELKNKIEALNDNSPIVVLQAQSDTDLLGPAEQGKLLPGAPPGTVEPSTVATTSRPTAPVTSTPSTSSKPSPAVWREEGSPGPGGGSAGKEGGEECVYRCHECGYSSHNKHYYKQHVDLVHNQDRPYKCPHCDYAGKRRHALLEHMVVHSNNRPFTCGHCNASFRKKGHLTNHIKLHTSQRLVHCGVCNIQLPDSEAFEAHLRKIHKTDKLFKCKLCEHTVVDREAMIKHFQTHNELVFYACPICDCHFSGETGFEEHLRTVHSSALSVPASSLKSVPMNPSAGGKTAGAPVANIMCSECGFVCSQQEVMQKHMWVHIKHGLSRPGSDAVGSSASEASEASKENSMGVLRKNIDAGQRTLPKDVFYQCTSCAFTSSDNSAFVKHMLAHKTQEKHQREVVVDEVKGQPQAVKTKPLAGHTDEAAGETQTRLDKSVPFVYDKAAARFRCLICNYHCEFQRTIKAHIWKHSGHQNIEYPMFDQSGNATSGPVVTPSVSDQPARTTESHRVSDGDKHGVFTLAPTQAPLPVFKTRSGDMVHLMPVDPTKASYNPGDLIQIKDNSIIVPEKMGKASAVTRFLESIVLKKAEGSRSTKIVSQQESSTEGSVVVESNDLKHQQNIVPSSSEQKAGLTVTREKVPQPINVAKSSSSIQSSMSAGDNKVGDIVKTKASSVSESKSEPPRSIEENEPMEHHCNSGSSINETVKTDGFCVSEACMETCNSMDESARPADHPGCVEPSVVVEVVDTIPPGSCLTGMKSQQGSPRVTDLDSSGGDAKLSAQFRLAALRSRDNSADSDTSASESENNRSTKGSKQGPESLAPGQSNQSHSTMLRCPFCDCQVREDFKVHLLSCKAKTSLDAVGRDLSGIDKKVLKDQSSCKAGKEETCDSSLAEDTDSTESSDETTAGDCAGSKKSGICSSLLAVIEQLRERSRSESEEDKQAGQAVKRSGRKKGRPADVGLDCLEDLKNIEKISESSSHKLRCVLCHYTSERVYNMKLHMKTHRQKKPSECSLCDFSSSSPEALQQHMLKHCKVRTYACKFCPQSFNHKSTLRAHLRAHKDQEPFLCAYCVFETPSAAEYREHMLVHSGCSSRLRCPGCDQVLGGKEELTAHLLSCSGRGSARPGTSSISAGPRAVGDDQISAPKSGAEGSRLSLQEPRQPAVSAAAAATSSSSSSTPAGKVPAVAPLEQQQQQQQHACVVAGCAFSTTSLKELQDHLGEHCNPSLLVCNLCDFKALHSRSLKSHMKRHANDQRYVQQPLEQYKCNLCGYVCHHLPSLKSHMWRHASDQSYSYEFTNDVINAAIDHDTRVDAGGQADDPELLDQVINSERRILEGELTKCKRGDGQRPICWVTFRCCSCGFETINKAKLNIHMRTHSDLIQQAQALDIIPRRKRSPGEDRPGLGPPKVVKSEGLDQG